MNVQNSQNLSLSSLTIQFDEVNSGNTCNQPNQPINKESNLEIFDQEQSYDVDQKYKLTLQRANDIQQFLKNSLNILNIRLQPQFKKIEGQQNINTQFQEINSSFIMTLKSKSQLFMKQIQLLSTNLNRQLRNLNIKYWLCVLFLTSFFIFWYCFLDLFENQFQNLKKAKEEIPQRCYFFSSKDNPFLYVYPQSMNAEQINYEALDQVLKQYFHRQVDHKVKSYIEQNILDSQQQKLAQQIINNRLKINTYKKCDVLISAASGYFLSSQQYYACSKDSNKKQVHQRKAKRIFKKIPKKCYQLFETSQKFQYCLYKLADYFNNKQQKYVYKYKKLSLNYYQMLKDSILKTSEQKRNYKYIIQSIINICQINYVFLDNLTYAQNSLKQLKQIDISQKNVTLSLNITQVKQKFQFDISYMKLLIQRPIKFNKIRKIIKGKVKQGFQFASLVNSKNLSIALDEGFQHVGQFYNNFGLNMIWSLEVNEYQVFSRHKNQTIKVKNYSYCGKNRQGIKTCSTCRAQ